TPLLAVLPVCLLRTFRSVRCIVLPLLRRSPTAVAAVVPASAPLAQVHARLYWNARDDSGQRTPRADQRAQAADGIQGASPSMHSTLKYGIWEVTVGNR
ncbi:hypothetical protein PENTCL1PPCAC_13166, partial [Pristionchus entomophagus]